MSGPSALPAVAARAGRAWPLGATADADGVNFAVHSAHAGHIEVCLFDTDGRRETARIPLPARSADVHHGHIAGVRPGAIYGLRAHGPWHPMRGFRFNPHKLLLDPYAREIVGTFEWRDEHRGAEADRPDQLDRRDNAEHALKARVLGSAPYAWGDDRAPCIPLADTVVYELHVRGFSKRNPAVPDLLRGTYAGLGHPASIAHLRQLGVTSVCLLPIHHHLDEKRLVGMGLVNYWGYNTIGFFCPDPRLAFDAGAVRQEFRAMVKSLHAAGIEVILDVVYNHTAETEGIDACISFQGLDNSSYYRLEPNARQRYENHTGCGNTVDLRHDGTLRLVMDSLRFWVDEMHVDGFRFDLATVLGRGDQGFDRASGLLRAIAQDPVLARVKLIAEPWDIGPGGYQVGAFPRGWTEWNDRFRDEVRGFWLRGLHTLSAFTQRLCASPDLFRHDGRLPAASLNYVVSHDGFTLCDLVSYERKHNEANGEENRDGTNQNYSRNCGVEGDSDDPAVLALRARLQRALLATVLLAQGIPMLAAGDELGHTQRGNNNPYCQDNEITWIAWPRADADLIAFTAHAIALRRELLPLGERWLETLHGAHAPAWLAPDGTRAADAIWHDPQHRAIGCLLPQPARSAAALLLLFNSGEADIAFALPPGRWRVRLDSAEPRGESTRPDGDNAPFALRAHSMALLSVLDA
jgi:glycogen operon protein